MKVFGKSLSEYVRFQKLVLIVIAAVGLLRLVTSLLGLPNSATRWLSMTVLGLAALVYYGITVHTSGFGSYKQLLPLVAIQNVVQHGIAIVGILLSAATGQPNVFTAPEYGGAQGAAGHVLGHVLFGMVVASLIGWGIAALAMLITKKARPTASHPATTA